MTTPLKIASTPPCRLYMVRGRLCVTLPCVVREIGVALEACVHAACVRDGSRGHTGVRSGVGEGPSGQAVIGYAPRGAPGRPLMPLCPASATLLSCSRPPTFPDARFDFPRKMFFVKLGIGLRGVGKSFLLGSCPAPGPLPRHSPIPLQAAGGVEVTAGP